MYFRNAARIAHGDYLPMKKILATLSILFCAPWVWGSGTSNLLQVSSGTFLPISLYSNPDAGNRQAIIIGDRVSSATVNVDPVTGLSVTISSGSSPIGNVNIISTNTLPVSGTFFQANQPVNFNNVAQPILITSGTVNVITTNTIPVSGTFFQATQPIQGTVNVISTQPFTVISTGVVTQPVSGTFFQANQPVSFNNIAQPVLITSGTLNVISTQPFTVYGTTVQVVNTTSTIQNIQNALPGGSNSLGNVNIISTNTLAVSGSFSATTVFPDTGPINGLMPGIAEVSGFTNPQGNVQAGRVTSSSETVVYVNNPSTITFNGVAQPIALTSTPTVTVILSTIGVNGVIADSTAFTLGSSAGIPIGGVYEMFAPPLSSTTTATLRMTPFRSLYTTSMDAAGVILGTSTANPILVNGSGFNQPVTSVNSFGTAMPSVGFPIGFSNPSGSLTAGSVTVSSAIIVAISPSSNTVTILSTPTVSVILSTVGAVGMFSDNGVSSTTNRITTLPGVYQTFNTGTVVPTQGRDAALTVLTDGLAAVAALPALRPYSYSASTNSFSIATSTNDAMALCGNATTTVEVYGIRASCTQTTAGNIQLGIVKRSSAYSGVWSTAPIVSQSSNYAGSKSTATFFTSANLVVGTLVGYLDSYKLGCMAAATATPNDIYISPSDWKMKPIVLNSASECVAINMNGATISGGSMSATFDFLERTPNNFNP